MKKLTRDVTLREVAIALQNLLTHYKVDFKVELGAGVNIVYINKAIAKLNTVADVKALNLGTIEDNVDAVKYVNRVIDLVNKVEHTITLSLTQTTSSNTANKINSLAGYLTTLAPTESNVIKTVSVTMGGKDITSTVYNSETKQITISSVTGNIVITATSATA